MWTSCCSVPSALELTMSMCEHGMDDLQSVCMKGSFSADKISITLTRAADLMGCLLYLC
jgi:hypothetical protein